MKCGLAANARPATPTAYPNQRKNIMTKNTTVPLTNSVRRSRLQELLNKLESGGRVTNRHLQMALTADEFEKFDAELRLTTEPKMKGRMPRELKRYAAMLQIADMMSSRKNCSKTLDRWQLFKRGPETNGTYRGVEFAYARALEDLEQSLDDSPDLVLWLDRPVDFDSDCDCPSSCPDGVPRLITSRSQYSEAPLTRNKRALKRIALQDSMATCISDDAQVQSVDSGCKKRKYARGVSNMPVDPNTAAERIFGDGKWQVI